MSTTGPFQVKKVAIIGAGPTGLATAKYLLAEHAFQVTVFEQRPTVGGVWNFTPETTPHSALRVPLTDPDAPTEDPLWRGRDPVFPSPMYEGLETNIPHQIMRFSDHAFPADSQLFPPMAAVLQYLHDYAAELPADIFRLRTQVLDVALVPGSAADAWKVTSRTFTADGAAEVREEVYDAVAVASGHYNVPFVPDIPGLAAWSARHPGAVIHSKDYRRPAPFRGKKVIVVGNAASGLDIGTQITRTARLPVLVSERSASYLSTGPDPAKLELPEIVEFLTDADGERAVRFKDGRVETHVDAVVFCTGYFYSYPFLRSLSPRVISDGNRVEHLYQHLFYIPHPTLTFIALPQKVIPFPVSEAQAAAIGRVWSNRLPLPSAAAMAAWERAEVASRGPAKGFHTLMFPLDADYLNGLAEWSAGAAPRADGGGAGRRPPHWGPRERWLREKFPTIKKAFLEKGAERARVRTVEDLGFEFVRADREMPGEHQQSVL